MRNTGLRRPLAKRFTVSRNRRTVLFDAFPDENRFTNLWNR